MNDPLTRTGERLLLVAACVYVAAFAWLQRSGIGDAHVLEWDARNMLLPAWQFHGTGLFPHDLGVEVMGKFATPGWKLVYWLGTFVVEPRLLSRLLPFAGLAIVAWQAYQFGREHGGRALGAATVILVVHCTMIWNRMAGGHARAFGYPLVIAFLRYASIGAEWQTLVVLGLQAACYPSAFLFCAPAYALTFGRKRAWIRFACVAGIALVVMFVQARPDPELGGAPTLTQAAALPQMGPGGSQAFYPLPRVLDDVRSALWIAFRDDGDHWHGPIARWNATHHNAITILLVLLVIALGRRLPRVCVALACSTIAVYLFARVVAYRLYLPDRILAFGWPPLLLLGLPLLATRALSRLGPRAPVVAGLGLVAYFALVCGDGLPKNENLTWFGKHDTEMIHYIAQLPKDVVIVTHPDRASYVQTYALRGVLFSEVTNVPWFQRYAVEMQRRIGDFFVAYYARDLSVLKDFAARYHVDYLIADERDFGEESARRAHYYEPWNTLNAQLLKSIGSFALMQLPPEVIVHRDATRFLVDLRRLSQTSP